MAETTKFSRARSWYLIRRRRKKMLENQWAGGAVLLIFTAVALLLANLDCTKEAYHHILETPLGLTAGNSIFSMSIEQWVNDALMVVFFFAVGLEIKREIIAGHLSNIKHAALPVAAALGGMIVPAIIYSSLNAGTPFEAGWGIPMATDIAFAIGILSLLGDKVPVSLKVFLTALAIVDDLGAILVIALFYTTQINLLMLGAGIAILIALGIMNRQGVKSVPLYILPGIAVWLLFLNSGVHATIAGVLLAMMIPTKPRFHKKYFSYKVGYFLSEFKLRDHAGVEVLSNDGQRDSLTKVSQIAKETISPALRLEYRLSPVVTFIIMPIFALVNAGVNITSISDLHIFGTTQGMGVFLGLVLGKPIGILLFCWLTIRLKLGLLPEQANWSTLAGVGCLGGIGFTMSIFIDNLAFGGTPYVDPGKIAVLMASLTAAIFGTVVLTILSKKGKTATN